MKLDYLAMPLEVKAIEDDGTFKGYGSVFNVPDAYADIVMPGAFKKSLRDWRKRKRFPPALWQHRSDQPVGPFTDMQEDERGLMVEGQLLIKDVQRAREAHALVKAKAINGLSIGYVTRDDSYDEKLGVRRIKQLDLWEVSIVTFPANVEAQINEIKSLVQAGQLPTIREFEEFLREQGFSRSQAEAIACHGFKHLHQRDAGAGPGDPGDGELLSNLLSTIASTKPNQ